MQRPAPLKAGSKVRVVAPSSPFDQTRFDRGLPLFQARYEVELAEGLFTRTGYLAGSDDARLAALLDALHAPDIDALIAARGGYGATRLLPALDVALVRTNAKWLVGFSDVTALHALWARAGLCSIHGPMIASLWEAEESTREAFFGLLEGAAPRPFSGLETVRAGVADGRLFGGNLTVLAALAGTPFSPPMHDVVLVLEDVTERPYRIDRMLTTMLQAGFFEGVRAIVLGQFTECGPGPDGVTVDDVLRERLLPLGVPMVANAPVGHVPDNHPLLFGARAQVDAARGTVEFLGQHV